MSSLRIVHPTGIVKANIRLPLSKSECNRAQVLAVLSEGKITQNAFSEAKDSQILKQLLANPNSAGFDVQDAGTAMRFLTAYLAFLPGVRGVTGTERMRERPVGPLVDALNLLGADIQYEKVKGFPPLKITGANSKNSGGKVIIPGTVSSQFLSALAMVAPRLGKGLEVEIKGQLFSAPYLRLTFDFLNRCGIEVEETQTGFTIATQEFRKTELKIGADWSAAGYWFSIAGLAKEADILLQNLDWNSMQADRVALEYFRSFGVAASQENGGVRLRKTQSENTHPSKFDFSNAPDLAQTMAVFLAAKQWSGRLSGLQSLHLKETDRVIALQVELEKAGIHSGATGPGTVEMGGRFVFPAEPIATYQDHRMAMAFATLSATGNEIIISDPEVVKKSYPQFWEDLSGAGFKLAESKSPA